MIIQEIALRRTIPVIINSFNQFTHLKNIIEKFINNGFCNIYVIDQGSSYPPLIEYLSSVNANLPQVLPIYLQKNNGPRWFLEQSLHEMFASECVIFTDPDMVFDELSENFVSRLLQLSHKYQIAKVGSALSLTNVNDSTIKFEEKQYNVHEWESQFWTAPIEENVYSAAIDTTFHLFNKKYYANGLFYRALRVAGDGFEMQHAPWMINDPMPAAEKNFYKQSKTTWGWWT